MIWCRKQLPLFLNPKLPSRLNKKELRKKKLDFVQHNMWQANSSCTKSILICTHHLFLNPKLSLSFFLDFRIQNEKKNFQILTFERHYCAANYHIRKTHFSFIFVNPKLSYLCCGNKYPKNKDKTNILFYYISHNWSNAEG